MRVALLLVASAHAFVRPTLHALRLPTQRPALSPEMAGAIAKAKDAAGYEAIVQETMVKEDCTYEEAVQRYNQYLFDPDGYSIIKMNEQIREAGFNSYEEYFIAEKGQEAWDKRQADLEADKQQKQNTSFIVVGSLMLLEPLEMNVVASVGKPIPLSDVSLYTMALCPLGRSRAMIT